MILRFIFIIIALAVAGCGETGSSSSYLTSKITRGDIELSVTASGTVAPVEVVDVGAQIVGQIISLGVDSDGKTVDYGSAVTAGTVLAKIDDRLYSADAQQAKANLARTEADLRQAQANLYIAERDWGRAQQVGPSDALSKSAFDTYRSNFEAAKAAVAVAEAAIKQAQAAMEKANWNLSFCTITSPVDGTVIDKRVNIGQTVVSSFNAPSLFLIAKDLKRIQVWASVNEADIGAIRPGQQVTFSVDAYPNREFPGVVNKIRLNASMVQNVVTYIVEIDTDNHDGKLLPYLTATVRFEVAKRKDVMLAPNNALRWAPKGTEPKAGRLWTLKNGKLIESSVTTGIANSQFTEIVSGELTPGDLVVTGEREDSDDSDQVNPFVPNIRGGRRS